MLKLEAYPFAQELIVDSQGRIIKVIVDFEDYQYLLEVIEEQGLYNAMLEVKNNIPLNRQKALEALEKD